MLTHKIVYVVRKAKFFSILADEATDCSNIEQMSLVLRFVDGNRSIREEFLGFIPCKRGVSGVAITNNLLQVIRSLGLSMTFCCGQGYDGGGNMAGRISGAAARIQGMFKNAIYVHCSYHILNLCVASSCQIQIVNNMMGKVRTTSDFFNNSPKRSALLISKVKELLPNSHHTHLIDVCRTRWVARIDGLAVMIELYPAVIASLEVIKENNDRSWNDESTDNAVNLYHFLGTFEFVITLIIVSRCLEVTRPLTKQLQTASYDASAARQKVSLLYVMLEKMR